MVQAIEESFEPESKVEVGEVVVVRGSSGGLVEV